MRALIELLFLLVLLGMVALMAAAWFGLADDALVSQQPTLSHQDIARAKAILQQNDPRRLPPGARRVIELSEQDLALAGNYLLQRTAEGRARVALSAGRLEIQVTLAIPRLPARRFLNIDVGLESRDGRPQIDVLHLGRVAIPGPLAAWLARTVLVAGLDQTGLDSAADLIERLDLSPDRLRLTYRWDPVLLDQARDTLLSDADREALGFYHNALVDLQARNIGRGGSLVGLLKPLFALAADRSRDREPVTENLALITVLGAWASRQDIGRLLPEVARRPQPFRLKIAGRRDFAQHFLTSAALAARADSALSDAVGLFKEMSDTDRGSGFSFTDIAADRAGTRFGEIATRSASDARRIQQRLAAGVTETDIMPPAGDLPEHMRGDAFRQRFGHVGSPAYQRMMAEIEQRIDACALYR
jgi:hypothetical protein